METQRSIVVAFKQDDGEILATQEPASPWSGLQKNVKARAYELTGDLADMSLSEIHRNYRVAESGKLEPKQNL